MIINDPYSGNAFGRIGKGIGQGLSEQLPKELERGRLSQGLKELESEKNLTPYQQAAKLYTLPGGAEAAPHLLPLLQKQNERQQYLKGETPKGNAMIPGKVAENIKQQGVNIHVPNAETGFVSPEAISSYKSNVLQEPSKIDIENLAKKKYLPLYQNISIPEAETMAKNELQQNLGAQKEGLAKLETDLNQKIKLDLQGAGFGEYEDVPGEIQNKLLEQARHMYLQQKMTPEQVSEKISNIITELGKTNNLLKENGKRSFLSSKEKIVDAKAQRKDFAKYGFGEMFDNMATKALDLSSPEIAHQLDPLDNKEIESIFKKYPATPFAIKGTGRMKQDEIDSIIKSVKPKDNLFDIEYKLRERGVNITDFKRRIATLEAEKKISLQPQQTRQLNAPVDNSWMGDILFEVFK